MIDRFNHVGVSVADLDRSLAFYRDLLGMSVVAEAHFEGPLYEQILQLKGASGRVALLETRGFRIELFEFATPSPNPQHPRHPVCDHGITHFCLEVSDLDAVFEKLSAAGVTFHCAPLAFPRAKATYARDPDGNVFELVQFWHHDIRVDAS